MTTKSLVARFFQGNFGDDLNSFLLNELFGITLTPRNKENEHVPHWLFIGSILGEANAQSHICGAGFIMAEQSLYPIPVPRLIHSVRGPWSRSILSGHGIVCPERYGDWGLLVRYTKAAQRVSRYALGVVPHYVDKASPLVNRLAKSDHVKIIDVNGPVDTVISDIASCDCVISSSLHGIIAADSLGIPNAWAVFSDKVVGSGFKFYDYFHSTGRVGATPIYPLAGDPIGQLIATVKRDYRFEFNFEGMVSELPLTPVRRLSA